MANCPACGQDHVSEAERERLLNLTLHEVAETVTCLAEEDRLALFALDDPLVLALYRRGLKSKPS